jgi:hypothetical protein
MADGRQQNSFRGASKTKHKHEANVKKGIQAKKGVQKRQTDLTDL